MLQLCRNFLFSPSVFAKSQICQYFFCFYWKKGFNTLLSTLQTTLANKLVKNGNNGKKMVLSFFD